MTNWQDLYFYIFIFLAEHAIIWGSTEKAVYQGGRREVEGAIKANLCESSFSRAEPAQPPLFLPL